MALGPPSVHSHALCMYAIGAPQSFFACVCVRKALEELVYMPGRGMKRHLVMISIIVMYTQGSGMAYMIPRVHG